MTGNDVESSAGAYRSHGLGLAGTVFWLLWTAVCLAAFVGVPVWVIYHA